MPRTWAGDESGWIMELSRLFRAKGRTAEAHTPHHEDQTWNLGVIQKAKEPCDGERGENHGFWDRREEGRRWSFPFVIAEKASEDNRECTQCQHGGQP
ncbi:hypothetical protein PHLCEN_2v6611 [Hermanssonia centrifuga]|uniref:Uncharacterized protein n=1 Tax=Hermanssonia centrifuga TaxID=98765 RepID=A0A2R6NYQ3_9APHY|nr:hypothetical protein PHLCEN_2v6611 [Hermanssonia centrifuga]